jgi:hypothetical protein
VKKTPGSKWAIKQGKERYRKEREAHRAKLRRQRAAIEGGTDEAA